MFFADVSVPASEVTESVSQPQAQTEAQTEQPKQDTEVIHILLIYWPELNNIMRCQDGLCFVLS